MAPLLAKVCEQHQNVPRETLKRKFLDRMAIPLSEVQKLGAMQMRSDAHSLLSGLEKAHLWHWLDYMRKHFSPPTYTEIRTQVRCALVARSSPQPLLLSHGHATAHRWPTYWRQGVFPRSPLKWP